MFWRLLPLTALLVILTGSAFAIWIESERGRLAVQESRSALLGIQSAIALYRGEYAGANPPVYVDWDYEPDE